MTLPPDAERPDAISLSTLPDGARGRIVAIGAGVGLRSRLTAMGLRRGVTVRVVRHGGRGPFVVAAGDMRIVLGRGMAHKVFVEVVPDAPGDA